MLTFWHTVEWQRLFDRAQVIAHSWGRALNLNLSEISTTQIFIGIAIALIVLLGIGVWLEVHKRRTEKLRNRFGVAEYTRAVRESGGRRQAELALGKRADHVEGLHIRPLLPGDRARFVESWGRVQARFVDGPAGVACEDGVGDCRGRLGGDRREDAPQVDGATAVAREGAMGHGDVVVQ